MEEYSDTHVAEVDLNPVVDSETWYQDQEQSVAFVAIRGATGRHRNAISSTVYEVIAGQGTMKFPEHDATLRLSKGIKIKVVRGSIYQTEGDVVMLATSTPPFNREAELEA